MKTYTVFLLSGEREVIAGNDKADALTHAGYSQGAVRAIDFIADGDCDDYVWDARKRLWKMTPEYAKSLGFSHVS